MNLDVCISIRIFLISGAARNETTTKAESIYLVQVLKRRFGRKLLGGLHKMLNFEDAPGRRIGRRDDGYSTNADPEAVPRAPRIGAR
ncbi:hypothetical protein [Burkholderia sp. BCC0405]|uniref:hypothetical protein n=1 Tax=Burkholderia sp. BCC0405 TaxID=2676298 RepID=UPI00158B420A|nr:hypothetical protein [Burkholderia sp. BCC0405]